MDTAKKTWLNGLFLIATLAVNALGATGVINGLSQKEISDRFVTLLLIPAPFMGLGIMGCFLCFSLSMVEDHVASAVASDEWQPRRCVIIYLII